MNSPRIFSGGPILTLDPERPLARALMVEGGRIVHVIGPEQSLPDVEADRIDLAGRTLLPGLTDAHTHLVHWGFTFLRPQLNGAKSLDEALERVAAADRSLPPGRPLLAEGWDESDWPGGRFPSRGDLDRLSRSRPIVLRRICGHMAVANGAALALLPAGPEVDPTGGVLLEEAAMGLARVFPPGDDELDEALAAAQRSYLGLGVTAVHDMSLPAHLRAFRRAGAAGRLHLTIGSLLTRPHLETLAGAGLGSGWRRGRVTVLGVKFFSDGSLGARTAALGRAYSDRPGERGRMLLTRDELTGAIRLAEAAGVRLAVHAIGDRAVDEVVAAFEAAGAADRTAGHRIEHLEMVGPATLARMRRLGLVASMQPNFIRNWGRAGGLYEARLGPERLAAMNPFRLVLDAGVSLIFGSDGMPAGPLPGLLAAVDPPFAPQRIGPDEALRAAIRTPCLEAGWPDRGVLAAGAAADFVELTANPLEPDGLSRAAVAATWVDGRRLFESVEEKRPTASGCSG